MNSIWIVTGSSISLDGLRSEVRSHGGLWHIGEQIGEGVIENDSAAIYISMSADLVPTFYDESELPGVFEKLGAEDARVVSIHIGHGRGSTQLAATFAESVVSRWGGFLDGEIEVLCKSK